MNTFFYRLVEDAANDPVRPSFVAWSPWAPKQARAALAFRSAGHAFTIPQVAAGSLRDCRAGARRSWLSRL